MDHAGPSRNTRGLKISAALIFIYFFAEIAVALFTGSLSLFADAAHELSTVVAISISLIAMRLAARTPTARRTFGLLRAEALAALLNGFLLVGMAIFIIVRGVQRLAHPVEMNPGPMFAMALGGIGLEIASLLIMYRGQKENLNIRASFWHVMNAFLGSLAVIIAAAFIALWGRYEADTWAGMVFSIVLLWAAYGILRDAIRILVDTTPDDIDLDDVRKDLLSIPGVRSTHHLHSRTITGDVRTFTGHLVVADIKDHPRVLADAKELLDRRYGFTLSTLQIEAGEVDEGDPAILEYQTPQRPPEHQHG